MEISIELLEELAADKGYKLVPIKKYERFLPCKCGCNRRSHWSCWNRGENTVLLECNRCGLEVAGKNEADAKRNWNETMKSNVQ